jgi:flagellar motor switch protein FliM
MGVDGAGLFCKISNDLISEYLVGQRLQTVATLLLPLEPERAAAILLLLPEASRGEILGRMRRSRNLAPEVSAVLIAAAVDGMRLLAVETPARRVERVLAALPEDQRKVVAPAMPAPYAPAIEAPPAAALESAKPEAVSGLFALVNETRVAPGRLPMLEVALDRFVRLFQARLGGLLGGRVEVTLEQIRSVRFGDYVIERNEQPVLLGVFRCLDWNHYGLLAARRRDVGVIADLIMGDPAPVGDDAVVPCGDLERAAFGEFCGVALDELGKALEPIAPGRFELDRLEAEPRLAAIDRFFNSVVVVELRLLSGGASARFDLVIPYAALEPVRAKLARNFEGEKFGSDPFWAEGLRAHLLNATVRLSVAASPRLRLAEIAAWRPGCRILLRGPIRAEVGGITVAHGRCGQNGGFQTFEVTHLAIGAEKETVTEALERSIETADTEPAAKLDLAALGEVRLRVSAVIGSADMSVADILRIGRGAVIELDSRVGEQVDVMVNDRAVAKGRIVIVEDRIAVAVEELL